MSWSSIFGKSPAGDNPTTEQIARLRKRDRARRVFGASNHGYRLKQVPVKDLEKLEEFCGIVFPTGFRTHLLTVGAGAGPCYGLWGPKEIREELETHYEDARAEGRVPPAASGAFPLTTVDAQKCAELFGAGDKRPWIDAEWPLPGCIPIGHQGCTYWFVLQLTGENSGCVWNIADEGGKNASWLPATRPTGLLLDRRTVPALPELAVPPKFEDWFQGWLDQCNADLETSSLA